MLVDTTCQSTTCLFATFFCVPLDSRRAKSLGGNRLTLGPRLARTVLIRRACGGMHTSARVGRIR